MRIDLDKLIDDAIYISYFELFHKYDWEYNNKKTRYKLKNDLTNKILDKNVYTGDFLVECDETNNSPEIIDRSIIMATVTYLKTNRIERKIINFPFGDSTKIIMPDKFKVYLRRLKINKIINKLND